MAIQVNHSMPECFGSHTFDLLSSPVSCPPEIPLHCYNCYTSSIVQSSPPSCGLVEVEYFSLYVK